MSVEIKCFEAHGLATGGVPEILTEVTNMNLKVSADPAQHYYLNDLQRPSGKMDGPHMNFTFRRAFTFRITGSYTRIKNLKIVIPQAFSQDNWRVSYALRTSYAPPSSVPNEFAITSGNIDGSLIAVTGAMVLYPLLHQGANLNSPVWTRDIWYNNSAPVWTQYLVLQGSASASTYDDVGNIGAEKITLELDEMEI